MTSYIALTILCGMACGAGLTLVVRELSPTHPRLHEALETISSGEVLARIHRTAPEAPPEGKERVGAWLERHQAQVPFLRIPRHDLDLLGETPRQFLTAKAMFAGIGFMFPTLGGVLITILALPISLILPFFTSLILAGTFWFVPDYNVKSRAGQSRDDFAHAAVSYLRLVAIQRLGSAGVVASMEDSSRLSDAWMFQRIRETLSAARYAGVTAWDAMADLSEQLEVPELKEIADITRLSESGASINSSLMARAASMRDRMLSKEHTQASRAITAMAAPTVLLLGLLMFTLLYPAVMKIAGGGL